MISRQAFLSLFQKTAFANSLSLKPVLQFQASFIALNSVQSSHFSTKCFTNNVSVPSNNVKYDSSFFSGYIRANFASTHSRMNIIEDKPKELLFERNLKAHKKEEPHTRQFWEAYMFIVKRVVDTCKIYLSSSPKERELVNENSRFAYVKKDLDLMSKGKQEDMLEYLISLDTLYGTVHRSQITAFLKDRHEGPKLLNILKNFLNQENPDFMYCVSQAKVDEKDLGKIGEKKYKLEQRAINELKGNLMDFRFYFQQIQDGNIRGL